MERIQACCLRSKPKKLQGSKPKRWQHSFPDKSMGIFQGQLTLQLVVGFGPYEITNFDLFYAETHFQAIITTFMRMITIALQNGGY